MTSSAERVGAGLAHARDARTIRPGERIHVIGAAGAGASAAAMLAAKAGASVTACDPGAPSPYTPALEALGIAVIPAHAAAHVTTAPTPDRLAVTKALTAIDPDHPELAAARGLGIPIEPWQQVVADAAVGRTLVGVAGTHGKSTTAGWLVHVLVAAGLDPAAFVGALLPGTLTGGAPATARWGRGRPFVVEADEYAGNFDPYRPDIAVVTSAEWDHPDVFADVAAVEDALVAWLRRAADGATLVANVGEPAVVAVVERLADWPGTLLAYALTDAPGQGFPDQARTIARRFASRAGLASVVVGRISASDSASTSLDILGLDQRVGPIATPITTPITARLATAGRHNAANALAVAGAASVLGLAPERIATALASFNGVGRRLERVGEVAGVVVYDDYAHHPTAIRETLAAIRQREPGRRVWAVLEPLTYHRTAAMLEGLADALAGADAVAIADIWAARDPDQTIASAAGLAEATSARRPDITILAPGPVEATAERLAEAVRSGDAVLVMGGGRSYRIAELLLERLAEPS